MSGGGVKGLGLLGTLHFLEDKNKLRHIRRFIGTSVGAIIGYLVSIGYAPIEVMVKIHQKQIMECMMKEMNIMDLLHHGGALNFFLLHEFLEDLTIAKIGHVISLGQLLREYGKELVCCTYNYHTRQCEYLNPHDHPDLPCLTALRMSCSLPFLFRPFPYNKTLYIDGAILDNFPISQVKDHEVAIAIRVMGMEKEKDGISKPSNRDTKKDGRRGRADTSSSSSSSFNLMTYLLDILSIPFEHVSKQRRHVCGVVDTVDVPLNVPIFPLSMSMSDKFNAFSLGYETIHRYFQKSYIVPYCHPHPSVPSPIDTSDTCIVDDANDETITTSPTECER